MQIRTDIHEYYALVSVKGDLGGADLVALGQALEALKRHGCRNLVLNLDGVPTMNAEGLKALVDHWGIVRFNQGDMKIVASGPIQNLFRAMGVDQIFEVCENVIDAISRFGSSPRPAVFHGVGR